MTAPGRSTTTHRRVLIGTLVAVAALVGVAAPAWAAGTYPTLAAANIRSGASTSTPVVTTVPKGSRLAVDCYVTGQSVAGTTIWDHVPALNGYISDSLLLTGSNRPVVPLCGTTPAPSGPRQSGSREDRAVAWALSKLHSPDYYRNGVGYCAMFAANAYGRPAAGYATALELYDAQSKAGQVHQGTAPKGALVFSYSSSELYQRAHAGHVAIATGDGRYVSGGVTPSATQGSVEVYPSPNPSRGATILGWSYAPAGWTGV